MDKRQAMYRLHPAVGTGFRIPSQPHRSVTREIAFHILVGDFAILSLIDALFDVIRRMS